MPLTQLCLRSSTSTLLYLQVSVVTFGIGIVMPVISKCSGTAALRWSGWGYIASPGENCRTEWKIWSDEIVAYPFAVPVEMRKPSPTTVPEAVASGLVECAPVVRRMGYQLS